MYQDQTINVDDAQTMNPTLNDVELSSNPYWPDESVLPPYPEYVAHNHEDYLDDELHAEPNNNSTPMHTIPANLDAERAVLGSVLIDPNAMFRLIPILGENGDQCFFRERHGWIYAVLESLHEKREPIDFVTVTDELERRGQLQAVGGPAYITELSTSTPTALYADNYAHIVKRTSLNRGLITTAGKIAELAYAEVENAEEKALKLIMGATASATRESLIGMRPIMTQMVNHLDLLTRNREAMRGIPTGFTALDQKLHGLSKSDLIIIAGRPSMGKTSFAMTLVKNAICKFNARIALFSLEMSSQQLAERLTVMETGIDSQRIRLAQISEEEYPMLLEAANLLANTNLRIDDISVTVHEICTHARHMYAEQGLDMVVIDYLQLMSDSTQSYGDNRQHIVSEITRKLKHLARELNIPVLVLSQLSRAVESRADKRPMLSDLRESGAIEQNADVVMFIYREDYYLQDTDRKNIADIIIAKHRNGETGTVSLFFKKDLTQFRELVVEKIDLLDYSV